MKRFFEIAQSCELVLGERRFDLHNCYGFGGVDVLPDRTVRLHFIPDRQWGGGMPRLVLEFTEVDHVETSEGFGTRPVPDVDEIGYIEPAERDDCSLLTEKQAEAEDHLFLRLSEIDFVRVHGATARVIEIAHRSGQ
jgi:hypothetical protein